jgi:hypothetical protein
MANKNEFDPYREALVMETITEWPAEYDHWDRSERSRIAEKLHADPEKAAQMDYIREHTGFCRRIVVTPEDIERVAS